MPTTTGAERVMAKKSVMYVLSRRGHQAVVKWDPKIQAEIKSAAEMFGQLQEQGQQIGRAHV